MVTYCYFFEATLSAEGGSYAQLAALIDKGTVNDQGEAVSFNNMGPLLPFWMWHCQGPDVGLLSESDLGVIGIGAKHFY